MINDNTVSSDMHIDGEDGIRFQTASGQQYVISKSANPDIENIGLADTQFSQSVFSKQEFTALNNKFQVAEIYKYLTGKAPDSNIAVMIRAISSSLDQSFAKVFPIQNESELYTKIDTNPTGKTDTITEEGVKQNEIIHEKVKIVPVRYAIDEFQYIFKTGKNEFSIEPNPSKIKKKHGLPGGRFKGGYFSSQLSRETSYTLRQLADGWLYVWQEETQTLHEYQVKGINLIRFVLGSDDVDSSVAAVSYLEYESTDILQIIYTPCRWTNILINEFKAKDAKARKSWTRKIDCSSLFDQHTGLIDVLKSVSDITMDASIASFPLSVPSIKDRTVENDKGETVEILGKKIQPFSSYPTDDTARVIALDDIWSDINDMVSQLCYLHHSLYETDQEQLKWRITAEAVKAFTNGALSSETMPDNVRGDKISENIFQSDLNDYFQSRYDYELSAKMAEMTQETGVEAGFTETVNLEFSEKDFIKKYCTYSNGSESDSELKLQAQKKFLQPYSADSELYQNWKICQSRVRYIKQPNTISEDLLDHYTHDQMLIKLIEPRVEELFKCHFNIPANSAPRFGFDTTVPHHQDIMQIWARNSFEVLLPHLDNSMRDQLQADAFEKDSATAFISTSFTGFDIDLYAFWQQYRGFGNTKSGSELNLAYLNNSATNVLSRIDDFYAHYDTNVFLLKQVEQLVFGKARDVLGAMKSSIVSLGGESWGRLLVLGLGIAGGSSGKLNLSSSLQLFLTNSYLSEEAKITLASNKIFVKKFNEWYKKGVKLDKEIKNLTNIVNKISNSLDNEQVSALNTGIRERTAVTAKQRLDFILKKQPKLEALKLELASHQLDVPKFIIYDNNGTAQAEFVGVMQQVMKKPGLIKSKLALLEGKGIPFGLVLVNIINFSLIGVPDEWDFSLFEPNEMSQNTYGFISSAGFLGAALTNVFSGCTQDLIKTVLGVDKLNAANIKTFYGINAGKAGMNSRGIMQLSASEATAYASSKNIKNFTSLLVKSKIFYRAFGVFAMVGSLCEAIPIGSSLINGNNHYSDLEKTLTVVKLSIVFGQVGAGSYFIYLGLETGIAGFAAAGPFFMWLGLAYLIVSVAWDYFHRDDIDYWLDSCRYGTKPLDWDIDDEFSQLQLLVCAPNVKIISQPTFYEKYVASPHSYSPSQKIVYQQRTGYFVLLKLPIPDCGLEVVEVHDWSVTTTSVNNSKLQDIEPIWLNTKSYTDLTEYGLPNELDYQFTKNDIRTNICLLRLPLENEVNGEFILRILIPDSKLYWEFNINNSLKDGQRELSVKRSGDQSWDTGFNPARITFDNSITQ